MGSKRKRAHQDAPSAIPATKKTKNEMSEKSAGKKSAAVPELDTSPFQDHPKGILSKRETDLYDMLSTEDSQTRLKAANAIVVGLLGGDGVFEPTLQRHLERNLFRGLASGRKAARLGRGVVLTEILRQLFGTDKLGEKKYPGLTLDVVLHILIAKTKPNGDLSGQEEKDHALGLLFGLQSFVRAKILGEKGNNWDTILEKLMELAKKKPWIREECGWVIMEALAQMKQSQAEHTLQVLYDAGLANTPEGVGIFMTAKDRFPSLKVPSKPWGPTGYPLDRLQSLAKALKESSQDDGSKKQEAKLTGSWNPKLHFVWDIVLVQFANVQREERVGGPDFENFWKVAVDDNLFCSTASNERKYWGFLLFQKVLQHPDLYFGLLPSIFSHNLVRCLINQMQEKDRYLNQIAEKSLRVVVQTAKAHPYTIPTLLSCLTGRNGTYSFDKATKSKTVSQILNEVRETDAAEVVNILAAPALRTDSADAEMRRQLLAEHIVAMVRAVNTTKTSESLNWIEEVALPILARVAYCKDDSSPPISDKIRQRFRASLMSVFTHVLSDFGGFSYSCNLVLNLTPDAVPMDEDLAKVNGEGLSIMKKLLKKGKSESAESKAPRQALALLYSLVIIQLYNGEPDAVSVLEELKLCRDKLVKHGETKDSDIDASEVLVELLLSFISRPSALLRKATQHVFSAFIEKVTAGGLKLMTDVLESSEGLRGQQELFDQEPEDGEDVDMDDNDAEMDSDVEIVDMDADDGQFNGHLKSPSDDDLDSDSDDSESTSGESEADPEDEALNTALAQILGTRNNDAGADAEESDSDADMTDSEMMALDSKLVEIFSQRKKAPNKKQEQKDAKETMINFKSRVLDLLEIYVKKQAANPLAFGLLQPLLQLMRTTKTKPLAEKASSIIQMFFKSFKAAKKADSSLSSSKDFAATQLELLEAIHAEVSKDPSHMFAKAASTASLLVASSLLHADKDNIQDIASVYCDSQVRLVRGEARIQASFFVEWINWCQSLARP